MSQIRPTPTAIQQQLMILFLKWRGYESVPPSAVRLMDVAEERITYSVESAFKNEVQQMTDVITPEIFINHVKLATIKRQLISVLRWEMPTKTYSIDWGSKGEQEVIQKKVKEVLVLLERLGE